MASIIDVNNFESNLGQVAGQPPLSLSQAVNKLKEQKNKSSLTQPSAPPAPPASVWEAYSTSETEGNFPGNFTCKRCKNTYNGSHAFNGHYCPKIQNEAVNPF